METRDSILSALRRALEQRTEWDEEPALYFLYMDGLGARLSQAAVPYGAWRGRPPEALEEMSYALQNGAGELRPAAPKSLYGMAFRCEAYYAVANERTNPGSGRRLEEDARARRISQRPDRVEIRFIQAVDRDGTVYYVSQRRDTGEVSSDVIPADDAEGAQVGGTVPEALDRMVAALLGVAMPPRAEA